MQTIVRYTPLPLAVNRILRSAKEMGPALFKNYFYEGVGPCWKRSLNLPFPLWIPISNSHISVCFVIYIIALPYLRRKKDSAGVNKIVNCSVFKSYAYSFLGTSIKSIPRHSKSLVFLESMSSPKKHFLTTYLYLLHPLTHSSLEPSKNEKLPLSVTHPELAKEADASF